jgi:outer membrane protein assembly factor BamD
VSSAQVEYNSIKDSFQVGPMSRRAPWLVLFLLLLLFTAACTNKKVSNPLANVGSKQPDKVLFDRAMDAMKHNRFDVARMTLQTLINTYPDSEYIARAKLAVADSWYAEGGTAALTQAEIEYKDFETFFPNMQEASEAQLKIANIHYQQMEKPDRDFTHAMRAEDEYRQLIQQYPDSKLVPEAKQRLLEVQEVLAQREFMIGRFYYLRPSYPAAIARLQSVVDKYPLFSGADEALYLLGQSYEGEIALVRASKMAETAKAQAIQKFTKDAAAAYNKILTRYPVMARAEDAAKRLQAMHQPVPKATQAALAQNQKEEESRRSVGMFGHLMGNFTRHPNVREATKVGDPTLVDPKPVSATDVVQAASTAMMGKTASESKVGAEIIKGGTPPPSEATPRSDSPAPASDGATGTAPAPSGAATSGSAPADTTGPAPPPAPATESNGIPELKPNVPEDASGATGQPAPPPPQVNEIQSGTQAAAPESASEAGSAAQNQPGTSQPGAATGAGDTGTAKSADTATSGKEKDDDKNTSSSKKKKKHKLIPF